MKNIKNQYSIQLFVEKKDIIFYVNDNSKGLIYRSKKLSYISFHIKYLMYKMLFNHISFLVNI